MFDLALSDEQEQLQKAYRALLERECSPEVVRESEGTGTSESLWRRVHELGVIDMAVPEAAGGAGAQFVDLVLVNEILGAFLAPVPVAETMAAARLLAALGTAPSRQMLSAVVDAARPVTLTPRPAVGGALTWVPGGAVADVVVAIDGDRVIAARGGDRIGSPGNLGSLPVAHRSITAEAVELARGPEALDAFAGAVLEWRGLVAAQAVGAGKRSLEIGVSYTTDRFAFGVPIASFQTIAHRLADVATAMDGAALAVRKAGWAVDVGDAGAGALLQMASWVALDAAERTVDEVLHFHGGYGFMLEYDIQLYFRRIKAWSLQQGDRAKALERVADLLWGAVGRP
jgi:alkylation response protein AidB-like acyl-CoA dehydrogenase